MHAMVLPAPRARLQMEERPDPLPGEGQVRVKISACGVCRTDLHLVDAELPDIRYPIVPGHEIVGRVDHVGPNVSTHALGDRVGIPWLGFTCGKCRFCRHGMENLCDAPLFTGYTRDGGYATHTIADARYAFPLGETAGDVGVFAAACLSRARVMSRSADPTGILAPIRTYVETQPATVARLEWHLAHARYTAAIGQDPVPAYHEAKAVLARIGTRLTETEQAALRVHPWSREIRAAGIPV